MMLRYSITPAPSRVPVPVASPFDKQLRLTAYALTIARFLYEAKQTHYGIGGDYTGLYDEAPEHVRAECLREAEEAVMGADLFHRREAERRTMLAFCQSYDDQARTALAINETHSKFYLIKESMLTLRRLFLIEKPWASLISTYRHALRGRE